MVKHPKFVRPNLSVNKRVKDKWRKPRGIDNKQASKLKWAGAVVNKGYRGPAATRGRHPSGKMELLVRNAGDLGKEKMNLQNFVIRMQAGLSKKSKNHIRKMATDLKLKVIN
ncbi:MAG: eL32 family ribosomal protein [Candidatus Micrarchaeota archaeon]